MIKLLKVDRDERTDAGLTAVSRTAEPTAGPEDELGRTSRIGDLVGEVSAGHAAAALRLEILRDLDRAGPIDIAGLPARWPVTRTQIRTATRWLLKSRLAEYVGDRSWQVRLTSLGGRVLEEIEWDEAIRSFQQEAVT